MEELLMDAINELFELDSNVALDVLNRHLLRQGERIEKLQQEMEEMRQNIQ